MTVPPAFPEWMRRADPILAREDTNTLFQAFRELRRRRHGWRARSGIVPVLTVLAVFAGIALLTLYVPRKFEALILPSAWVIILLYGKASRAAVAARTRLPSHVERFFQFPRLQLQVGMDLWLCPLVGPDVFEAIYLERREAHYLNFTAFFWMAAATISGLFVAINFRTPADLARQVPVVVLLLSLGYRWGRAYIQWDDCGNIHHLMLMLIANLPANGVRSRYFIERIAVTQRNWTIAGLMVIATVLVVIVFVALAVAFPNWLAWFQFDAIALAVISIIFHGILSGVILLRKRVARATEIEATIEATENTYEDHMEVVYLGLWDSEVIAIPAAVARASAYLRLPD